MAAPATTRPGTGGSTARSAWMDVDWRDHQRWVTVEGRPVNVIELGSGPPLIFVHGLGGAWQNWLEQLLHFASSHRVVAIDLPGFGHSPMPAEKISIRGYAQTLDRLCEALETPSAVFVGNSMGGFVSAELAITRPQRVERLVLVSAAGITEDYERPGGVTELWHREQWPTMEQQWRRRVTKARKSDRRMAALRRFQRVAGFYAAWTAAHSDAFTRRPRLRRALLGFVVRHPDQMPAPLAAEQVRGAGKPGFIDALEDLLDYRIRERLGEISCPTLIVWGTNDHLVPLQDASAFEELIPNARKVVFEDTGHVPQLERPDRFNAELERFLAE